MFKKTKTKTETCLHMTQITAHFIANRVGKVACGMGREGDPPPSLLSGDVFWGPVSLPLRLWVMNCSWNPCVPCPPAFASLLSACSVPPRERLTLVFIVHSHVSLHTFATRMGKWLHGTWSCSDDNWVAFARGWTSKACGRARLYASYFCIYVLCTFTTDEAFRILGFRLCLILVKCQYVTCLFPFLCQLVLQM